MIPTGLTQMDTNCRRLVVHLVSRFKDSLNSQESITLAIAISLIYRMKTNTRYNLLLAILGFHCFHCLFKCMERRL